MRVEKSIGCIGGVRLVRILLYGWGEAGVLAGNVTVNDPHKGARDQIAGELPAVRVIQDGNTPAAGQDLVLLAVHPPYARKVLGATAPAPKPGAVLISLMSKLTIAQISGMLGGFNRIIRMIPNALSMVLSGYTPVVFSPAVPVQERAIARTLLDSLGGYLLSPSMILRHTRQYPPGGHPIPGSRSMSRKRSPYRSDSLRSGCPLPSGRWREGRCRP